MSSYFNSALGGMNPGFRRGDDWRDFLRVRQLSQQKRLEGTTMKNSFQRKVQGWTCGLVGMIFCISCAAKAPVPKTEASVSAPGEIAPLPEQASLPPAPAPPAEGEAPAEVTYFTHTVRFGGETVSIIAGWYTGDIENWKALVEANSNIDPKRVLVGNKILIPEDLLKTREPMPQKFVDNFYKPKQEKGQATKPRPSLSAEEPKLFGPKGQSQK
jgi:hypothetical protein